jgi:hypothetical protein
MKQILLLIAVYALIINQSTKSELVKKELQTKTTKDTKVNPQLQTFSDKEPTNPDFIAPVFTYSTLRFLTGYPSFTQGQATP